MVVFRIPKVSGVASLSPPRRTAIVFSNCFGVYPVSPVSGLIAGIVIMPSFSNVVFFVPVAAGKTAGRTDFNIIWSVWS